jgi:hypothetical protein
VLRVPSSVLLTQKCSAEDDENPLENWGAPLESPKLVSSGISFPRFVLGMGECCLDVSSELEHLLMSYEIYAKNMSN